MRGLFLIALLMLCASQAWGHAQLTGTTPAAGTVVAEAPATVRLAFNEPVAPLSLRWVLPDGTVVPVEGRAEAAGLVVVAPAPLPQGTQIVSWRVVSQDGHPVAGTLVFSIGAASGMAEPPRVASRTAAVVGARFLLTLLLTVGVGGAVFARLIDGNNRAPRWTRHIGMAAACGVPLAAGLFLAAQGLDFTDAPIATLASAAPWRAALTARMAATMLLASLAGLFAALALTRTARTPAYCALGFGALSFAAAGHAATAPPVWLIAPSMAVHGAALLFWLGALGPFAGWAATGADGIGPALRRFSALAVPWVVMLILSGITLTVVQLGSARALLETGYGRILGAKLLAVVALLGLAAVNRRVATPRIVRGATGGTMLLARTVGAEILLALIILLLASSFRLTPPPRALPAAAIPGAYLHLHGPSVMADVTLRPGRPGANSVEIALSNGDFGPIAPLEVSIAFAQPESGVEAITLAAQPEAGGLWRAGPVVLPRGGRWQVTLRTLITDFDQAAVGGEIDLGQ